MTNKPDIAYRLTTSTSLTKDELLEAANEIVDLREKVQLLELQYSVLLAKYDELDRRLAYPFVQDYEAEQTYCDSCGDPIECGNEFFYDEIPCDIASANKGESATLCRKCDERIEADYNNGKFRTTNMRADRGDTRPPF